MTSGSSQDCNATPLDSVGPTEAGEGPRGLREKVEVYDGNMAKPKCQACIDRHFNCTYTTHKRKPGPRKGSTSARELKIQAQLDRFEKMLQHRQHGVLPFPTEYTGSPQITEPRNTLDYALPTSTAESHRIGLQTWTSTMPNDISDIEPSLNVAHQNDVALPKADCPNLNFSEHWAENIDIAAESWENQSQHSRISASSNRNSQGVLQVPNANLSVRVDEASRLDLTLDLSTDMEMHLISLYFTYLQPIYPLFQKAAFFDDYHKKRIRPAILYAMFALSSRYSSELETLNHSGSVCGLAEAFTSRAKMAYANSENADGPITLDDLRAAFLLCVYEYTSYPGRKAWVSAGNIVRMAYELGLHQIDASSADSAGALSELEKEARRHVWWCVWKLDAWVGISGATPFVINEQVVCTAFTSTTPAELADSQVRSSSQIFLNSDVDKAWSLMRELQTSNEAKSYNMFIVVNHLMREVATISALRYHSQAKHVKNRHEIVANALAALRLSLPPWFCQPVRNCMKWETTVEHKKRLEVLIQLYISRLLLEYPHCPPRNPDSVPLDDEAVKSIKLQWTTCTSHAEAVVGVLRDWDAEYFRTVNPETSCAIWLAAMVLIVQTMIGEEMDSQDRTRLLGSVDILALSLEQFAQWWHFCHAMLDSVNVLKKQAFSMQNFNDVYQLLSVLQNPFNPRHIKFLKLSDYQISRPQQPQFKHAQDPSPGPQPDLSHVRNDTTWQEMFLAAADSDEATELFQPEYNTMV
ncbi:fungal-specific transcription factor domain-containing protein [Mariannaea sp. PMI_226]|nr:fungal-specific transcription factor domain-containing protein [Mariannaea sp. PMI_226]